MLKSYYHTEDYGVGQISKPYHEAEMQKMGLDIMDYSDNLKFAVYLYKKNGSHDYLASRDCWIQLLASK